VTLLEQALCTADDTKAIEFGPGVVGRTGDVFRRLFPGTPALVVADENTLAAAGELVLASLDAAGVATLPLVFPGTPIADYDQVSVVRERLGAAAIACSVGAGTLNDLVKLASGELGQPYLHVATAASVDGYTAFGASISRDGFKITRPCPAPAAVIADVDIMAAAPQRLTSTGYGDLIEKIPAGADWLLADTLGIEPIQPVAWDMVQTPLWAALADPDGIARSEPAAVGRLAECALLSGLAMQATRSSRPASGAGHQFSHMWEMEGHGLDWSPPLSHGFKVAVGTVASCALWEAALALDLSALDIDQVVATAPAADSVAATVRRAVPPRVADEAVRCSLAKHLEGDALRERLTRIRKAWPEIQRRVRPQLKPAAEIQEWLRRAGAPYHPQQIGIDRAHFRQTHFTAQMIRTRYTVLDLLLDVRQLTPVVDHLFAPGGFWGDDWPRGSAGTN